MASDTVLIREMDDYRAAEVIVERLEGAFKELVFSAWDQDFLRTDEGKNGMRAALVDRYLASRRHAVPWLDDVVGLSGTTVVEIGCGTGSSTVALAERDAVVFAIDIDEPSVAAARSRVDAHEVDGVSITRCEAEEILEVALAQKADLYVLFAVLEHLTEEERCDTLHSLWSALEPGGALAIIETPNRLSYFDSHSSEQDFVHLLPDHLAFQLANESPRQAYRDVMGRAARTNDPELAHQLRIRFGLGASFHEFVAAIDDPLDEVVIADGYEDEITSWFGMNLEELTLLEYMIERKTAMPMAFARPVLNMVLRKPADEVQRSEAMSRNESRRRELSDKYARAPLDWRLRLEELNHRIAIQAEEIERLRAAPHQGDPRLRGPSPGLRRIIGAMRSRLRPASPPER
jgi:S-adenosylmethionine-dependent methyltransferase